MAGPTRYERVGSGRGHGPGLRCQESPWKFSLAGSIPVRSTPTLMAVFVQQANGAGWQHEGEVI